MHYVSIYLPLVSLSFIFFHPNPSSASSSDKVLFAEQEIPTAASKSRALSNKTSQLHIYLSTYRHISTTTERATWEAKTTSCAGQMSSRMIPCSPRRGRGKLSYLPRLSCLEAGSLRSVPFGSGWWGRS